MPVYIGDSIVNYISDADIYFGTNQFVLQQNSIK